MNDKERSLKRVKTEYILEFLREYTDGNHSVNSNAIIKYLKSKGINCARKSVYNDINSLIEFGYDIIRSDNSTEGYFLAEREFEISELRLIIDAVASAPLITEKKTVDLIEKLMKFLSSYQREMIKSQITLDKRVKLENEQIYYVIDSINRAISEKRQIEFDYYKYHIVDNKPKLEKKRRFTLSPYALIWANDKYYLVGNYEKYNNLSNYRIDRIKMANVTDIPARPYQDVCSYTDVFDAADYARKNILMWGGDEIEMELVCSNELLDTMIDKFGIDVTFVNKMKDRFYISTRVFFSEGLVDWLFTYCDKLKILSPKILKDRLLKKTRATLESLEDMKQY